MKKTKHKKVVNKVKKTIFSNEIKHLEVLRAFSIKAVTGDSESIDDLFVEQALRIQDKITKLKENQ